jgi:uncharacterized membrane protein
VLVEIADPTFFSDMGNTAPRQPTVLEFDIIRQIDGNDKEAKTLVDTSRAIILICILFVLIAFIFFTLATRGHNDPYIWNFFYTM